MGRDGTNRGDDHETIGPQQMFNDTVPKRSELVENNQSLNANPCYTVPRGRRLGFLGLSFNDGSIIFLVILLVRTVSLR